MFVHIYVYIFYLSLRTLYFICFGWCLSTRGGLARSIVFLEKLDQTISFHVLDPVNFFSTINHNVGQRKLANGGWAVPQLTFLGSRQWKDQPLFVFWPMLFMKDL